MSELMLNGKPVSQKNFTELFLGRSSSPTWQDYLRSLRGLEPESGIDPRRLESFTGELIARQVFSPINVREGDELTISFDYVVGADSSSKVA